MRSVQDELNDLEVEVKQKRKHNGKRPDTSGIRQSPGAILDSNLSPTQEAYCRGLSLGMSRQEAMGMAGVKDPKTARGWDKLPAVRTRVTELTELITENSILKNGLDRGWVISRLMTVTERCMQAEPVLDRQGNHTGEYQFDSAGANRALELLGKTMRMFDAKENTVKDEYAHLSDDEIARIAAELAAQTGLAGYIAGTETPAGSEQVIEVQALPSPD